MPKEHDRVVITDDLGEHGLKAGDVGVIVFVHRDREAFEVEFLALDGNTVAVATVRADQIRAVTAHDVSHARKMGFPA